MTQIPSQFDFTKLSVPDRIALIGEIWDSIENEQELPELSAAQKQELERRLEECRVNPDDGYTWEEVKARIKGNNE